MTHTLLRSGDVPGRGPLLVRDVRPAPLPGETPAPHPVDVRLEDGLITEVGRGLPPRGEPELDAAGRWAIPGLWDQHVHFTQWARAGTWLNVKGSRRQEDVVAAVRRHAAARPDRGLVTAFGYRSATWPEPASVRDLDAASAGRPVVAIAGDAHNGWLNSRAQQLLGVGPFTGAVRETEWFEIFRRLGELPGFDPDLADFRRAAAGAARRGVTGIVDLEFSNAFRDWPARVAAGVDHLRVAAGVYPAQLREVVASGQRTGDALPDTGGLAQLGPLKIISDGSLGTRSAWCCEPYTDGPPGSPEASGQPNLPRDELVRLMHEAAAARLQVVVHAIGDAANRAALDAFAHTGARGRVEHAQLLRAADVARFAALGVAASVQPAHLIDDRDTAAICWSDRGDRCFVLRSLLDAGAGVLFGSDAPVSPLDPWLAIAAAVHRSGDDRPGWHPEQSVSPAEAIGCSVDGQRIAVGSRGDLAILDSDPLIPQASPAETARLLRTIGVHATVCAGRVTHLSRPG